MLRFYLRVALFGDPVERKPRVRVVERAKSPQITQLKPLAHAK